MVACSVGSFIDAGVPRLPWPPTPACRPAPACTSAACQPAPAPAPPARSPVVGGCHSQRGAAWAPPHKSVEQGNAQCRPLGGVGACKERYSGEWPGGHSSSDRRHSWQGGRRGGAWQAGCNALQQGASRQAGAPVPTSSSSTSRQASEQAGRQAHPCPLHPVAPASASRSPGAGPRCGAGAH